MITLKLRIENTYELYDDEVVIRTAQVPPPPIESANPDGYAEWQMDHINVLTGSASGTKTRGDSWADITVLESSDPRVIPVGSTWDWGY